MSNKNPVVHFEMPYDDAKRVSKFYQDAFGWKMNQLGASMNDYITAETTETDKDHMVKRAGAINGGFFPKNATSAKHTLVTIAVEDIEKALKEVVAAGGKVLDKPVMIPGIGLYAAICDTGGNRVSLLQPKS